MTELLPESLSSQKKHHLSSSVLVSMTSSAQVCVLQLNKENFVPCC